MVGRKWWCFGNQSSDDLDPVLLVTGVGGSILNSKPKSWFGVTTRVWVRILLADLEFRKKVWSLYNPDTGSFVFSLKHLWFFFFCFLNVS
ncbi:putative phospholipase A(1) [Helianthus debilis subsp. tardiflorus]